MYSPKVHQFKVNYANKLIPIATACNGRVFGGWLRDCHLLGKQFKDLDLWFQNKDDANRFYERIYPEVIVTKYSGKPAVFTPESTMHNYPFEHMVVHVGSAELFLPVDIVVAAEFPVNDFRCNLLWYDGKEIGGTEVKAIIEEIKARRTTMLPSYVAKSKTDKENFFVYQRAQRLKQKGFKIDNYLFKI